MDTYLPEFLWSVVDRNKEITLTSPVFMKFLITGMLFIYIYVCVCVCV